MFEDSMSETRDGSKRSPLSKCQEFVKHNKLVLLTLCGVAVGFLIGFLVQSREPSADLLMWIGELLVALVTVRVAMVTVNL